MTEFEKGYEQGYKDGTAGAALPNVNDNGDKIDGYSYAYKTDSNGEPYIHIDSVRGMLKESKQLLKLAVEDFKMIGKALDEDCDVLINCEECPLSGRYNCRSWNHEAEALALIGKDIDVPASADDTNVSHKRRIENA